MGMFSQIGHRYINITMIDLMIVNQILLIKCIYILLLFSSDAVKEKEQDNWKKQGREDFSKPYVKGVGAEMILMMQPQWASYRNTPYRAKQFQTKLRKSGVSE